MWIFHVYAALLILYGLSLSFFFFFFIRKASRVIVNLLVCECGRNVVIIIQPITALRSIFKARAEWKRMTNCRGRSSPYFIFFERVEKLLEAKRDQIIKDKGKVLERLAFWVEKNTHSHQRYSRGNINSSNGGKKKLMTLLYSSNYITLFSHSLSLCVCMSYQYNMRRFNLFFKVLFPI